MGKAKAGALRDADARELEALGEVSRPDFPLSDVLHEARELDATLRKLGPKLVKGARLDGKVREELSRRRALLDVAEAAWLAARERLTPRNVVKTRATAEALKRDAVAALRYFLAEDAEVQLALDEIAEGSGDADLIDDLRRLAGLVEAHAEALRRADLPKHPSDKLRALAQTLADATADRAFDPEAAHAGAQRNRAFWHLRDLMDRVRAGGRYVFRNDRKLLKLFRATSTRAKRPTKPASAEPAPATPPTQTPGDNGSSPALS